MTARAVVDAEMVDRWRERIEYYLRNPDDDDLGDLLQEMHNVWCELERQEIER